MSLQNKGKEMTSRAVDFYVGAEVSINASPFLLVGADDKARWIRGG